MRLKKGLIVIACSVVMVMVFTLLYSANAKAALELKTHNFGDGNLVQAYEISTPDDMNSFSEMYNNGTAVTANAYLASNLQFVPEKYARYDNFVMLGTEARPYSGQFDGCGYKITKIRNFCKTPTEEYEQTDGNGFVAHAGNALVENLTLADGWFSQIGGYSGSIIGKVEDGCKSKIVNCHNSMSVATMRHSRIGGILGGGNCDIISCSNTYKVDYVGSYCGGIAGLCYGKIENCYNSGYVSGFGITGGIVGKNYGTVINCINTGLVFPDCDRNDGFGGIAGVNGDATYSGTITNCINTADVHPAIDETLFNYGGVLGVNANGSVKNCYYCKDSCHYGAIHQNDDVANNVIGLDIDDILSQASGVKEFDFNGTWTKRLDTQQEGDELTAYYPLPKALANQGISNPEEKRHNFGTSTEPDWELCERISNPTELDSFARQIDRGRTYLNGILTKDIDMEDDDYLQRNLLTIGDYRFGFSGKFDGCGHIVQNIQIDENYKYQGLFGQVDGGTIQRTGMESFVIKGGNYVGAIAANVESGTIKDCYARGEIHGTENFGGIVGNLSDKASVSNCYYLGTVGEENSATLVGTGSKGCVQNCYYNKEINPTGGIAGEDDKDHNVMGMSTAQMTGKNPDLPGFDFDNVWEEKENDIHVEDGETCTAFYPTLICDSEREHPSVEYELKYICEILNQKEEYSLSDEVELNASVYYRLKGTEGWPYETDWTKYIYRDSTHVSVDISCGAYSMESNNYYNTTLYPTKIECSKIISDYAYDNNKNVYFNFRNGTGNMHGDRLISRPITILTAPVIHDTQVMDGRVNWDYEDQVSFSGNRSTLEITKGRLPDGLTLSNDGAITGTPTEDGDFYFELQATNELGSDKKTIKIHIDEDYPWIIIPIPSATPTVTPSPTPTIAPVESGLIEVTSPSPNPVASPEVNPMNTPSASPAATPGVNPTGNPTAKPAVTPVVKPSETPKVSPSVTPGVTTSAIPSAKPITSPSNVSTGITGSQALGIQTATPSVSPSTDVAVNPDQNIDFTQMSELTNTLSNEQMAKQKVMMSLIKPIKAGKRSNKLTWRKVKGAAGYYIYGAACKKGKAPKKLKLIKNVSGKQKAYYTHKKLKKNTWYKYVIVAYRIVNGKKIAVGRSLDLYSISKGKGKLSNPAKIKSSIKKLSVKKKKTKKWKVKLVVPKGKKIHSFVSKKRYFISNKAIVSINKKGVIKGKKKGKCKIYVIAQNGLSKCVKITVK